MKMRYIIININLKKRRPTVAIDPLLPAYSVYSFENDGNSGRPLTCNLTIGVRELHVVPTIWHRQSKHTRAHNHSLHKSNLTSG